jgi:hypothetical protein
MKTISVGILFILTFTFLASAQMDKSQRPSPPAQTQCSLANGKTIKVDYSSPRLKGRHVGGEVAPFDKIWRTGANEATTFVTSADFSAGTVQISAGNYTLFSIPAQKAPWTLIISKVTGEWGIPYKDEYKDQELARIPMKMSKISAPVENFTIGFVRSRNACTLQLSWENTRASVKFTARKK